MKKKLCLCMLLGLFALLFKPYNNNLILHAEDSVEESSTEQVEESTNDFEQKVFIWEDEENELNFEITLNTADELYLFVSDYEGTSWSCTTNYVTSGTVYYVPALDFSFKENEDKTISIIERYDPLTENEEQGQVVEQDDKSFFESIWGMIVALVGSISIGSLLSVLFNFLYNLSQKNIKEKENETLTTIMNKLVNVLRIVGDIVASTSEDKEMLKNLLNDTSLFLKEIKETLESQKTDIEKINALSVKFNTLLNVISKTVSVHPEYLNVAEDINIIIDKELGK